MAASRSVVATLAIDGVEGVVTGFKRVRQAAEEYGRVSQGAGKTAWNYIAKHAGELDQIGTKLLGLGALGAVAMGGLGKAAMDWESAWAGVTKTVDGSREQMSGLETDLRNLAKELPASHQEIAAVAEAAGQLGVHVDDVAAFTKTMINLGETTNMSAEEAATTLQRFMNVMGTSTSNVDRLGSTIVGLGNSFATTEAEIATMAQRIAGVGRQLGMSEGDVLGFAAAMSSVGIEAEAGGTAISMSMKKIDAAVREGGDGLSEWAKLAGVSAGEFKRAWGDDAATAMASVVEGLGGVVASGESAAAVLDDLGIKGIRESDVMNRLALATQEAGSEQNLLRDALEMAAREWEANNALQLEAEKRYETRAAKAQIAINSIKDEAITLGQYLLPAIDSLLQAATSAAEGFGALPDGIKESVLGIAGITTAAALAAGGLLKLVVAVSNAKVALAALGISARTATIAMGAIGLALTAAGAVLGAWMSRQAEATARAREYTDAIRTQGQIIGETTRQMAAQQLEESGLLKWAKEAGVSLDALTEAALGSKPALDEVNRTLDEYVAALERKVAANQAEIDSLSGRGDLDSSEVARLNDLINANDELNARISERVGLNNDIRGALAEESAVVQEAAEAGLRLAEASGQAGDAAQKNAEAQQRNAEAYAEVEQAAAELLAITQEYGNYLLDLSGSQIAVEESIARLEAGFDGLADGLDLSTEAGRKNQEALDSLARSSMSYIETLVEGGASADEVAAATERARAAWERGAAQAGMTEDRVKELSAAYFGIPDDVNTETTVTGDDDAKRRVSELNERIKALPESKQSEIKALVAKGDLDAAERKLNGVARDRTATISTSVRIKSVPSSLLPPGVVAHGREDGAVVDYYASGGLRERHVAQIAPAGSWRVWAEPETGGEAYIPLAPSKRTRSLEIWRETGRRLGVQGYRDGAVVAARHPSPGLPSAPIPELHFTANGVAPEEVAREARDVFSHEVRVMGRVRA